MGLHPTSISPSPSRYMPDVPQEQSTDDTIQPAWGESVPGDNTTAARMHGKLPLM